MRRRARLVAWLIARPFQPGSWSVLAYNLGNVRRRLVLPTRNRLGGCGGEKFRLKDDVVGVGSAKFDCQIEYVGFKSGEHMS